MTAGGQEPRCRYCGCTEDRACTIPGGDTCAWYTADRDVCTYPPCISKYHADDVAERRKDFLQLGRRKRLPRKRGKAA